MTQPDPPVELDVVEQLPTTLDVTDSDVVEVQQDPDVSVDVVDESPSLELSTQDTVLELEEASIELDVSSPGPAGAPGRDGVDGSPGQQGPPGSLDNASYIWQQNEPDTLWVVPHNLGFHPAVSVVDSGGTTVEGNVQYLDISTVVITFDAPFGGVAYLS